MLVYSQAGRGPAVVLIHGFGLCRVTWDRQVADLSGRYRVITPDLPGHGETPPFAAGEEASVEGMAREVLSVLDELGIESAAVAGHSMGGYVTLAMHKLAPHRITGVAILTSQAGPEAPEARAGRMALLERVEREGTEVLVEVLGPKLFAPGVAAGSSAYRQVMEMMRRTPVKGIRDSILAMLAREDMREHLGAIGVPALLLTGEYDRRIPPERTEEMALAVPGGVLVNVPGSGHMVTMEADDAVVEAMSAWLARVYPG